jgi:hypothetical protein
MTTLDVMRQEFNASPDCLMNGSDSAFFFFFLN